MGDVEEKPAPETEMSIHQEDYVSEVGGKCEFTDKVDVDHILKHYAGNIGFVQIIMVVLSAITLPAAIVFPVFGNTELPHRCRMDPITEELLNSQFDSSISDSFDKVASLIGPWPTSNITASTKNYIFGCQRFNAPYPPSLAHLNNLETIPCDNGYVYKYSTDQYPGGIVNEWDLVCNEAWKVPFSTAMYMGGMLLGFISGGLAGDKFGRRLTALIACILDDLAAVAISLSPNFWLFIAFRVFLAFTSSIKIAVLLVLCMETTTARQRSLINGIWSIIQCFVLRAFLSLFAQWFPNWRWFHGALCATTFLSFPFIFLFPESPRWLVSQNRKREALHELYRIYRVNLKMSLCKKKSMPITEEDFISKIQEEASVLKSTGQKVVTSCAPPHSQFRRTLRTFKNRKMARLLLQCVFLFSGQLAATFGLVFYGSTIRANIYLVNFLNSATSIPATIISGLMYRYSKRRKMPIGVMYISTFVVLAIATIYNFVAKPDSDLVLNICCNLALILLAASLNMVFMYVPELFASEARVLGLGVASGLGRIGGVICPFVNALDSITFHGFPIIVYMAILLLEMLNLAWLPDTSGRNLLDNYETGDEIQINGGDSNVIDSRSGIVGDGEDEDGQPIWASTVDELIASTHVIRSVSDEPVVSNDVEINNKIYKS